MTSTTTPRPDGQRWQKAELYRVALYNSRLPVCGCRLVWAIVGWKWVYVCTPVTNIKWKMRRAEWDGVQPELYIKPQQTGNSSQLEGDDDESTSILESA